MRVFALWGLVAVSAQPKWLKKSHEMMGGFAHGARPNAPTPTPTFCGPGKFSQHGQKTCQACPPGKLSSDYNAHDEGCKMCPVGRWTSQKIEVRETCDISISCKAGTYMRATANGANKCADCPQGQYSIGHRSNCPHCPHGKTNFETGQTSCPNKAPKPVKTDPYGLPWIEPQQGDNTNDESDGLDAFLAKSLPTPAPTVEDDWGKTFRQGATANDAEDGLDAFLARTVKARGSPAPTPDMFGGGGFDGHPTVDKNICMAGKFQAGSVCKVCPTGKFQALMTDNGQSCKRCPVGKYSARDADRAGCTMQNNCPVLQYMWHYKCFNCPTGRFNTVTGTQYCTPCSAKDFQTGKCHKKKKADDGWF